MEEPAAETRRKMRTRGEIEADAANPTLALLPLILEVVLDIRDGRCDKSWIPVDSWR